MPWKDRYEHIVWDEFACHFDQQHICRGILHCPAEKAAKMIAQNYKEVGMKKSRADAIRSMILNCK